MKLKRITPAAGLIIFCLMICSADMAFGEGITWYPYQEGKALAKSEGKKIFLHFTSMNCGYCRKMNKETFKAPKVIRYLNQKYISIKVTTDKPEEVKMAQKYRIRGVPSNWFLTPDGEVISQLPGYRDADYLLPRLQFIGTDSYRNMSFEAFRKQS